MYFQNDSCYNYHTGHEELRKEEIVNTEIILELILSELQKINSRLDRIEETISTMKQDITDIKAEQAVMKQDIADIKAEQAVMKQDIRNMKASIYDLQLSMGKVEQRLTELEKSMTALRLFIEQNVEYRIKTIADGHHMIIEKMNHIEKMSRNYEAISLKVDMHDCAIKQIKQHLAMA